MRKIITFLFLVILIIPLGVIAKTPNQEEIIKVINSIENVQVDDSIIIKKATIKDKMIELELSENDKDLIKEIPYTMNETELEFLGGYALVNTETGKVIEEIKENNHSFYIYSLLENKSFAPYEENNYYNNTRIKEIIETKQQDVYKDSSNTFGVSFKEEMIDQKTKKVSIAYHYYFDGDYTIINIEQNELDSPNPPTGTYNKQVTIMLCIVIGIGLYTYFDSIKKERKGI